MSTTETSPPSPLSVKRRAGRKTPPLHRVERGLGGEIFAVERGLVGKVSILGLLAVSAICTSQSVHAHPMDSYAIDQYLDFRLRNGEILLVHRVEFAEIPTAAELPDIDTNSDMILTDEETAPYVSRYSKILPDQLELSVDGTPTRLEYRGGDSFLETVPSPRLRLVTQYACALPAPPNQGLPVRFFLKHRPQARGDRQTRLVCEGPFSLSEVTSSENVQPPGMAPPSIHEATALVYGHEVRWVLLPSDVDRKPVVPEFARRDETAPAPPANPFLSLNPRGLEEEMFAERSEGIEPQAGTTELIVQDSALPEFTNENEGKKRRETWADRQFRNLFLPGREGGLVYFLLASVLALVYGAVHAMEPGHGKTVVAAYLVGSHGTVFHAVLLALIVTFTHTFSVYILGLIALTNLDRVQGTYLPVLECGSWFLILLMGVFLFLKYYKYYVLGALADPAFHSHGLGKAHSHGPAHHTHDHEHEHNHNHENEHSHHHDHHSHDDAHSHDHSSHQHSPQEVSFWNLLVLGITGGIVPCPGALFVMMMALTSRAIPFGLYLITVFSAGLALTLMTVGIAMVKGRGALQKHTKNSPWIQVLPVFSSLVIIIVGAGFLLSGLMKHGIVILNLG